MRCEAEAQGCNRIGQLAAPFPATGTRSTPSCGRSIREQGGEPSSRQVDELLDERDSVRSSFAICATSHPSSTLHPVQQDPGSGLAVAAFVVSICSAAVTLGGLAWQLALYDAGRSCAGAR